MLFTCNRSGLCCTHPNIAVTLTHEDLWSLYQKYSNIEELQLKIQFLISKKLSESNSIHSFTLNDEQLVLKLVETNIGFGHFILRKEETNKCTFFNSKTKTCEIHDSRPQACKNFPFSFSQYKEKIIVSWVKNAKKFCSGIGGGKDYSMEQLEEVGIKTMAIISEYNSIVDEINKESKYKESLSPKETLFTLLLVAEKNKEKFNSKYQIL